MAQNGIVSVDVATLVGVLQHAQLSLCRFTVLEQLVVARLEVQAQHRVRVVTQLGLQYFQRHIIVVQLLLAEGNLHVESDVFTVIQQQALVDVGSFLEV